MLKDDYLDLMPGEAAEVVGRMTHSVEDFVVAQLKAGATTATLQPRFAANADVLFHGHCHQKALWSTAGSR